MRLYSRMLAALLLNSECPILGWGAIQGTAHLLDPSSSSRPPAPAPSTTTRYAHWSMVTHQSSCVLVLTYQYLLTPVYQYLLVCTGQWSPTNLPVYQYLLTNTTTTLYDVTINSTSYYPLVLLPANTSTATCTRTCTKTNIKSLQLRPNITPTTTSTNNPVIGASLQSGFPN